MTIPIHKEPIDLEEKFGAIENCHFCRQQTRYWHGNTNNPVCPRCSKNHKVGELPDYGQNIRAEKKKQKVKK